MNAGSAMPRELFGNIRNVTLTRGGVPGAWTWTLTFQPTPIAWRMPFDSCVIGSCGGAALMANLVYDGFVTGYVTDLVGSGLDATEIAARTGYVHAYNAQDATMPLYDFDTNSLVIRLANPHLRAPGVPATGSYETFLPYPMLTHVMNVPDPSSLTGGSITVSRTAGGATTTVPFTLSHTASGIAIAIPSITYSSPTYRIRVKRTRPGAPRIRAVRRLGPRAVEVRFLKPLANGGAPITRYIARCRTANGRTFTSFRIRGPIAVTGLPSRRRVTCAIRAQNRIGKGPFSATRSA